MVLDMDLGVPMEKDRFETVSSDEVEEWILFSGGSGRGRFDGCMNRLREFIFSRRDSAGLGGGCGGFWAPVEPCGTVVGMVVWSWSCLRPSRGLGKRKLPGRLFLLGGGRGPLVLASPFGGNGGFTAVVGAAAVVLVGNSTGVLVCD